MELIRITDDNRQLIERAWLASAERVHRQLRPQLPADYVGKMLAVFGSGGEMCVMVQDEEVVGIAVFRYFENRDFTYRLRRRVPAKLIQSRPGFNRRQTF